MLIYIKLYPPNLWHSGGPGIWKSSLHHMQPNHIYETLFLGQFWTDSLVHDVNALKLLVDVIGEV